MILYLVIDILLLLSVLFEFQKDNKIKKVVIFVWCVFFTLFGGLRWEIGGDWEQYYGYFNDAEWSIKYIFNHIRPSSDEKLEPAYAFLNILLKSIVNEFWFFNLVLGAFAQFTYYKFSTFFSPRRPLMLYIIVVGIGVNSYMFVRSGFSLIICYWAFIYIKKRSFFKFLLVVLFAASIHRQVLSLIPLYWAWHLNIKSYIYICVYLGCVFFSIPLQNFVTDIILELSGDIVGVSGERIQMYVMENSLLELGIGRVFSYTSAFMYLIMLCIFLYFRYFLMQRNVNKEMLKWVNCLIFAFFLIIISNILFTGVMSTLGRMFVAFKPARAILVVMFVSVMMNQSSKYYYIFGLSFFIGLSVLNIHKDVTDSFIPIVYSPYHSIFY